jgi:trehalose synthase
VNAKLTSIELNSSPVSRFRPLLDDEAWRDFESAMRELAAGLRGRVLWNINSTAQGGGVAELLASLIPYDRDAGVDERWLVIEGSPAFFAVTKRIHTLLHGIPSEGSEISPDERREYEQTLARNAAALVEVVRPGDIVIIHDPQAAGLVPPLTDHGAHVIWRSHVGVDRPNDVVRSAWNLLRPYLDRASALVFSRPSYVWEGLDPARVHIIAPTIDPFSVKNQDLGDDTVKGILHVRGSCKGPAAAPRSSGWMVLL